MVGVVYAFGGQCSVEGQTSNSKISMSVPFLGQGYGKEKVSNPWSQGGF